MSNPNPTKQRRPDAMSARMKAKLGTFNPRPRQPGEALLTSINLMQRPEYKPAPWVAPVR